MAKHRRQGTSNTRRVVTSAACAATASAGLPSIAQAAEVVVPNTNISFHVEGLEHIPGIKEVPDIERFVPSLSSSVAQQGNYSAAVDVPQAQPQEFVAPPAPVESVGDRVVAAARSAIGSPYGWGAAGPNAFDCSGLTSWAYAQVGKSIPRTSQAQAAQGQRVSINDIQPGDIVVYYGGASHVAIYTGNGLMIDSLQSGSLVGERPLNYMPIHSIVRF